MKRLGTLVLVFYLPNWLCTPGSTIAGKVACKQDEFTCNGRRCVPLDFRCDGKDDCGDGSDEASCQSCTTDSFLCVQSGGCVSTAQVCNGAPDCSDGTDELVEMCGPWPLASRNCPSYEFTCRDGLQCVPHSWRCDHTRDCTDGSDEDDCDQNECLENNGGCSHLCVDEPMGFVCGCPKGMRLVRDTQCEEVDECLETDSCSQLCIHVNGTFTCDCNVGYFKSPTTGQCRAGGEVGLLVFSGSYGLRRIDTVGMEYRELSRRSLGSGPLAVYTANRTLFWADVEKRKVYMLPLDQTSKEPVVVLAGLGRLMGLAVDWLHALLYWTDASTGSVNVATLNGSRQRLLIGGLLKPTGVAVQPLLGLLFWAESGRSARIERSSMDGEERMVLVSSALYNPIAISIDMPRSLLYWVDAGLRTISRVGLDGRHRKTVLESNGYLDRPFGLAVFESHVFWSDEETGSLCSADKHNGSVFRVLLSNISSPGGLVVTHSVLQPEGEGVCGRPGQVCPFQCVPRLFDEESPHFSCHLPAGTEGHNESELVQAAEFSDTTFAGILSLVVLLSIVLAGLALWWWQGEISPSRILLSQTNISLKESQDPLVPVKVEETCPLKDSVIKMNEDES